MVNNYQKRRRDLNKRLIQLMGSKAWDIRTLTHQYNLRYKWGKTTKELCNSLRCNNHIFEVIGTTEVILPNPGYHDRKKKDYLLYKVKEGVEL
tara:strand:- start:447 stop:725 length:279 start_codon:yes stop_codon:yes gene_type:complete